MPPKPSIYPHSRLFSSGPCTKYPGWSLERLSDAALGRSHRSTPGKAKLNEVIARSRELLKIPADYRIGIVPASDTGAFEAALWSLLGPLGVDVLTWESFGQTWASDVSQQLKIADTRVFAAEYGRLPDLSEISPDRDTVFAWNGTTSGVCVPHGDWISSDRTGLTFCDATSAAFAMELPWSKLDVVTWSWQKALGGEAQHGMIALSPRALSRLEGWTPPWPMPKIFRLTTGGKLIDGIFRGETINTPSMLAVEDHLDALRWAQEIGGLDSLIARSKRNLSAIEAWVAASDWVDFLAQDRSTRSCTSVCLRITAPDVLALEPSAQVAIPKKIAALLETENAAHDIGSFRAAPAGLRIWAGATVETADLEALFPWLDWAFAEARAQLRLI